jgi:two-component system, cell cycle sensor histidine kinase and response regulator CckA
MQPTEQDKKQILVVEDERLIAVDLQRRLERLGYVVPAVVSSGEEALLCSRSTPFDLVLMDIRLAGDMDGIATAKAIKAERDTAVIFLTAHSDPDTLHRAKLTEPHGYILKPITDGDLRSVLPISLYKHSMERRVRASEAWLSTTLRSVGEGIIATNVNGEIVFMNPVAELFTGWAAATAYGKLLMEVLQLFEESSHQPAKNPIQNLNAGDNGSYELIAKSGSRTVVEAEWYENRSSNHTMGAILVMRDISERRASERRLMQSQRMEAVANMAGALAHDFNNQLMVIMGYAEELSVRLSGSDQEDAREIRQAASIAGSITAQLLTLSRRDAVSFQELDINEVVREVLPLISHSLGRERRVSADLATAEGVVLCDRNQLKQVLLNLSFNARDAMPSGGELRFETSFAEISGHVPAERTYRTGRYVRLRAIDTGQGMDSTTLNRIFEPFFTTKKAGAGTGLGLSIVHSIVTQSGGYISVTSEPGKGTSFQILLPCVATTESLDHEPRIAGMNHVSPGVIN